MALRMVPACTETCRSSFYIFNNHIFYTSECISWIIQWLIIVMHGVIMKSIITVFTSSRTKLPAVENKIDEALVSCVLSKEHLETIV